MATVVFYVNGHGFGHAVRVAEVVSALGRLDPSLQVHVRTTAPASLFPPQVQVSASAVECSMVQRDAVEFDRESTLEAARRFQVGRERTVQTETAFLRQVGAQAVLADIPWLAFPAARQAGVPGLALGNFSWDWVYAHLGHGKARYEPLVQAIRDDYSQADLLLRLPLHGEMSAFRRIKDVPLIARVATSDRRTVRGSLGLPKDSPVVLLSFGGFSLEGFRGERLAQLRDYTFVAVEPMPPLAGVPNARWFPRAAVSYLDLLAAVDIVITKPGYGIVTDCLANRVRVLYTDRGDFPEYPILARSLEEMGTARYIPRQDLLAGAIGPYLDDLLGSPGRWQPIRTDGAEAVAREVLTACQRGVSP